jgi:hypothetical protein
LISRVFFTRTGTHPRIKSEGMLRSKTLQADKQMTGDQSRLLKVSARVRWADSVTDLGTVAANAWGGVVIKWDDGRTSTIHHNDMAQVQSAPKT